ncbi:MAG: NAD(+)/NADH kinase [Acidobacteria bacterium]|nr:NAD(+)/NADH kinase [Acidobacteriota bacterium]
MAQGPVHRKAVGIVSKPNKPEVGDIIPGLIEWLSTHNFDFIVDPETRLYAGGAPAIARQEMGERNLEFVIVLGGDGTLLSAARAVARAGIPIVGVNLGALGFLTEVPLEELYSTLESITRGSSQLDIRAMVHCEVNRDGVTVATFDALNDVVVGKATIARLNHCDVYIDTVFVSRYQADSLIVSTPTGSTAYALAAGGPILMPDVEGFVVTPVSAHSLTHRPLVVRDSSRIEILVMTGQEEAYLSIDGQAGMPLQDGDRVHCRKSQYQVKLLHTKGTFFDVLHSKLKWGQR